MTEAPCDAVASKKGIRSGNWNITVKPVSAAPREEMPLLQRHHRRKYQCACCHSADLSLKVQQERLHGHCARGWRSEIRSDELQEVAMAAIAVVLLSLCALVVEDEE